MYKISIPIEMGFCTQVQDPKVLGVFVKLLLASTKMRVNGVFVNGKVFTLDDIAKELGVCIDEYALQALIKVGMLKCVHGVYFIENAQDYFSGSIRYCENTFSSVMAKIRETVSSSKQVAEIAEKLTECGDFQMENDATFKDKIIEMYNSLDVGRGKIQSYVGMFRTKNQISTGSRMKLSRHYRLLSEIKEIYELGSFDYDGQRYSTTKEKVLIAIDIMLQRQMKELTNHNYLKVILKNDNIRTTRNDKGKTNEGY